MRVSDNSSKQLKSIIIKKQRYQQFTVIILVQVEHSHNLFIHYNFMLSSIIRVCCFYRQKHTK